MTPVAELSYSQAVAELENILRDMQSPDCDIDKLSAFTSRALELLKHCKQRLTKTDEEVRRCLEELNI
ncbi:MAG: exodeoxyribonuclease VII small subunit [Muribaculum sp.]|nr:exodeoxyribonuclease VII small subunit [Muribaculum sp.]